MAWLGGIAAVVFVACTAGEGASGTNARPLPPGESSPATGDGDDVKAGGTLDDGRPPHDDDAGTAIDAAPPPKDKCPALPIPATCNGRSVVYREFGPNAKGDGTYFADQAPWRLGFNRIQGNTWIVKFRTENDTYSGRISAYGDNTGGVAFISDKPCDATFAIANRTVTYGNTGGGMLLFKVARNAADAQTLKSDPKFYNPSILEADHCYYAVFQNTGQPPSSAVDLTFINTAPEQCGNELGCYYLAFDMGHRLHDFSGRTVAGNVIPGLTVGP